MHHKSEVTLSALLAHKDNAVTDDITQYFHGGLANLNETFAYNTITNKYEDCLHIAQLSHQLLRAVVGLL